MFPLFAAGVIDTGGKFAIGINDTSGIGGKFTAGVVDTGSVPWLANISANFRKNLKWWLLSSEAWGKIYEKNQKQKISWHILLKSCMLKMQSYKATSPFTFLKLFHIYV